jgi:hypothetical protein
MSNPTTPFSWQMPTATDLVTDLPADFEVFGQAVATSMADLLGGTSGQILAKNSNTDMDFVWIANDQGDITGITATSPLTGGGTSGAVTVGIQDATTAQKGAVQLENSTSSTSTTTAAVPASVKSAYDLANAAIPKSLLDAAGDVIYATANDTPARLALGTAGQVLTVNSGATAPEWATPAAGGSTFVGCQLRKSANQTISNVTDTIITFDVETFDTDGFHSTSSNTGRITIPAGKAGKYRFDYTHRWQGNATGSRAVGLRINGVDGAKLTTIFNLTADRYCYNGSFVLDLGVGDYVELICEQDSGGNLALQFDANTQLGAGVRYGCEYLGA